MLPEKIVDHKYVALVNGKITDFKLSDLTTKYIIVVFYPLDFTFVCPTEVTKLSNMHDEFLKENCSIVFASTDSVYAHSAWVKLLKESKEIDEMKWPMISDITHKLSSQFNLFSEQTGTCMRGTVILDKSLKTLHLDVNIDPIGRSSKELLRLVKVLNYYDEHSNTCPIDLFN